MPDSLKHLVDRVSGESWDRFLPPPSTLRREAHRPMPHRSLAIVGAAALVVGAVAVPATLANRVSSTDRRAAAAATAQPCAAATGKLPDLRPAILTVADTVPGYEVVQSPSAVSSSLLAKVTIFDNTEVAALGDGQVDNGFGSVSTDGRTPAWQLMHQVFRYSPGQAQAAYAAVEAEVRRQKLDLVSSQGGAEPQLVVRLAPYEQDQMPKAGNWSLVTRAGDCLSLVALIPLASVQEVAADGPGAEYFEQLGQAIRAKALGGAADKVPLPGNLDPIAQAPKDYLQAADFSPGTWRAERLIGGRPRGTIELPTADCKPGGTVPLTRPSTLQIYKGTGLPGEQEWNAHQMVLRMSESDAIKFMNAQRASDDAACTREETVAKPSGIGDEMLISHQAAQKTPHVEPEHTAYVRDGGTIIFFSVYVYENGTGPAEIPNATAYLTELARKAIDRARNG